MALVSRKKRPGRLKGEDEGCQKREAGKSECKKKKKTKKLTKGHVEKGQRENRKKQAVWKKHRPRDRGKHRVKITRGPIHALQRLRRNPRGFGFSHETVCPWTGRFLLNCPRGRSPPSLARDLFFELD